MSKSFGISTGAGTTAIITGDQGVISVQRYDTNGHATGDPIILAQDHGFEGGNFFSVNVDVDSFSVDSLSTGGFEIAYNETVSDVQGFTHRYLAGVGMEPNGALLADPSLITGNGLSSGNIRVQLDMPVGRLSGAMPAAPQVYELAGGRFAVAYETFDSHDAPTSHVAFGSAAGLYSDTVVSARPDFILGDLGDVTLVWTPLVNPLQQSFHEQLADDGTVLADRHLIDSYVLSTGGFIATPGFDAAHGEIIVRNPGQSIASGPKSTLTFDARDHSLTWDQDSEGPAAPVLLTTLNVDRIDVTNLQVGWRPEVLKVIAADGSSTIQWFDSDSSQSWASLKATETPAGDLTTYSSLLDDGMKTVFTFDADNSQAYTRYVDQDDAGGRVLVRSVLYDDATSWTARYSYANHQVVSYELDSFDAAGRQVGQSFFNADGTPLGH